MNHLITRIVDGAIVISIGLAVLLVLVGLIAGPYLILEGRPVLGTIIFIPALLLLCYALGA